MAIKEVIDEHGKPKYLFLNIHGGGWEHDLMKIITEFIYPNYLERKLHKAGWYSSDSEILFEKNNTKYKIHLDEMDSIEFKPISENFRLEIVREYANIIDVESEKIQNKTDKKDN